MSSSPSRILQEPSHRGITLIRMSFDYQDGDNMLDPLTERPDIGFIDPNIPTQVSPAGLNPTSFAFGPLRSNWNDSGTFREVYIRSAMSESYVSEPPTFGSAAGRRQDTQIVLAASPPHAK